MNNKCPDSKFGILRMPFDMRVNEKNELNNVDDDLSVLKLVEKTSANMSTYHCRVLSFI